MNYLTSIIIQLLLVLGLSPLVGGIIKKLKAFSQKRKGPPLLQLYYDLYKLFQKDTVVSETASWIFKATPYIYFCVTLLATLLIPVSIRLQPLSFAGDLILVIYLLAVGRFFMTLTGLDTGSTFGGMGSSRESMIAALVEPALMVALLTIAIVAKSTSIFQMLTTTSGLGIQIFQPVYLLSFLAVFTILITETARIPVDDPATHLELTMVHEAMLLEYSGKYLALMEYGAAIKQLLLITLLVNLFIPVEGLLLIQHPLWALLISLVMYVIKVIFMAVLVAIVEINTVKLRLFSVPNLTALAFILAFLAFFQQLI